MNVLFLTRYPYEGASSRYRVFQYIPYFEALGMSCHVQSFMDRPFYSLSFTEGRSLAKIAATFKAVFLRLAALRHYKKFDIIYIQRELFPFGPPVAERYLRKSGAKLVFDYDDALFIKKASRYNKLATIFRKGEKTYEILKLADCVIAGNDYLRDVAAQYCNNAHTVEVAEDTGRIQLRPRHHNDAGVLIGWLGSKSTVKYLRLIEPVMRGICKRYPQVRFEIVGGGDFEMANLPVTHTEWSLDGELEALRRFDIGLMPLPPEDWSKGKSGGKARTYMAAGVPPVCTAIGYNLELVKDGETGFLCTGEPDWENALCRLIESPELRDRIGSKAREEVVKRFSPEKKAHEIFGILSSLLGKNKQGDSPREARRDAPAPG